jgi:hypothetical protein
MATPWVNAPEIATPCKRTLTFRIHSQVGVFVGRPYKGLLFIMDQTHGVAMGCG